MCALVHLNFYCRSAVAISVSLIMDHKVSISTANEVHSTLVSLHAAAVDSQVVPNSVTPLGEQGPQMADYQSISMQGGECTSNSNNAKTKSCCEKATHYRQKGTLSEHIVYFCALSAASYIGVLARIYLAKLAVWNGIPFFYSFYPEIVGTAIMGFIGSHKKLLQVKHKAVYQAIATGLCGSITTFSSWNSEAVTVLLQIDQEPVDNFTRVIGWLTIILLGLGMPIAALQFGKHLSHLSPWNDQRLSDCQTDSQPSRRCITIEGVAFVMSWVVCTVVGIVVPYNFNRLDLLFSIVFAAFGTYIRWHLSPLNSLFTNFKFGTFIVNVFGAWVLGAVAVSRRYLENSIEADDIAFQVLIGLGTGFCGCLTTVSTFSVELTSLSLRATYFYALCSILLAQTGLILIRGPYEWV